MGELSANVFAGDNPIAFNPKSTIPLFIVQLLIIICFCRIIGYFLGKLRQPQVISEILGGVLLGPSVMGQIPGFHDNIFPDESLYYLQLVANLGLLMFLFIVGLELDLSVVKRNIHKSAVISISAIALTFGLSSAVAYAVYNLMDVTTTDFGTFVLFMGVAMSITAFPVLARILTELNMLHTTVGVVTIGASAVDDVISWCLLALVLAVLSSSGGLVILWVLLCTAGFVLTMLLVIRPLLYKFFVWTNSFEDGPNQKVMFVIFLVMFISGWITQVIGVYFIFGAFVAGVIIPHDQGFAVRITEKIEDLVTIVFLPIYFALSGLKTDFAELGDGITWGMIFLIIAAVCGGKVFGATFAARACRMNWRESFTIGMLMNCKGLVELIVLNIGYDAGAITTKLFTMMVVMALFTTFITTPAVLFIYPRRYHRFVDEGADTPIQWEGQKATDIESRTSDDLTNVSLAELIYRPLDVVVCLSKAQHIPSLMVLMQFLRPSPVLDLPPTTSSPVTTTVEKESDHSDEALDSTKSKAKATNAEPTTALAHFKALRVHALRLVALTQRNSAVMMYADAERTMELDPLVGMFRTFGRLNGISVRTGLHLCPVENFAEALSDKANMVHANYTIVPWSGYEDVSEDAAANTPSGSGGGALDYLFPRTPRSAQGTSPQQLQFITDVFVHSLGNVVVFLDRGFDRSGSSHGHGDSAGPVGNLGTMPVDLTTHSQYHQRSLGVGGPGGITAWRYVAHVVVPFFGGRDDRAAVHMALQFAANHGIKVTIARFIHVLDPTDNDAALGTADFIEASNQMTVMRSEQLAALPRAMVTGTLNNHPANVQSTVPQHQRTTIRLQSEQEDEALFNMLFQGSNVPEDEEALAESTSFTLTHYPNVTLELVETSTPLQTAIVKYRKLASHDLIVLGRGKDSGPGHRAEIEALLAVDGSHANNLYGSPNSGLSTSDGGYQPVDPDYADYKGTSPEAPGSAEAPILARQQNPKYGMLGDAAERFLAANCSSSLMVVQGRRSQ